MRKPSIRVLLIAAKSLVSSSLQQRLERRQCRCWSVPSAQEGLELFRRHKFQVIVTTDSVSELMPILPGLAGSNCTVFSAVPVENGCWWLPVMRAGDKCFGAPAIRSSDFPRVLDETIDGLQTALPGLL